MAEILMISVVDGLEKNAGCVRNSKVISVLV